MSGGRDSSPVGARGCGYLERDRPPAEGALRPGAHEGEDLPFDDYVFCVLEHVLTTSEQTLADAGQHDLIRRTRTAFRDMLAEEFQAAVAEATGRPVVAYHSQISLDPDMGFEIFVLGNEQE